MPKKTANQILAERLIASRRMRETAELSKSWPNQRVVIKVGDGNPNQGMLPLTTVGDPLSAAPSAREAAFLRPFVDCYKKLATFCAHIAIFCLTASQSFANIPPIAATAANRERVMQEANAARTQATEVPAVLAFMGAAGDPIKQQELIRAATVFPMVVSIHAQDSKTGERRHIVRMYEMKRLCDITEFEHSFLSETEIITRCETLSPQHLREMPQLQRSRYSREYRCYLEWRAGDRYDPIRADEDLHNWLRPGRYVGD